MIWKILVIIYERIIVLGGLKQSSINSHLILSMIYPPGTMTSLSKAIYSLYPVITTSLPKTATAKTGIVITYTCIYFDSNVHVTIKYSHCIIIHTCTSKDCYENKRFMGLNIHLFCNAA